MAAGGIAPLVALAGSGMPGARKASAGALWSLAKNADNKVAIAAAGGIAPLVALAGSGGVARWARASRRRARCGNSKRRARDSALR